MLKRIFFPIALLLILLGLAGIVYDQRRTPPYEVVALEIRQSPPTEEETKTARRIPPIPQSTPLPRSATAGGKPREIDTSRFKATASQPEVDSVELEYPTKMISGSSGNIKVRFRRTSVSTSPPGQSWGRRTESLTLIPLKDAVPGPLKGAWGPDYETYARPGLTALRFDFLPQQVTRKSLEPPTIEWGWQITPKEHTQRQQTLTLILEVDGQNKNKPDDTKTATKVIDKDFYINVVDKTFWQKLWGAPLVIGGLLSALGIKGPDVLRYVSQKKKAPKKEKRSSRGSSP